MKRIWMLAVVMLASVCASAQCSSEITALRDLWVTNWNAKQLDKVMDLYALDATYLSTDGQRVTGRDNIKAYFKKLMDAGNTEKVNSVKSGCSGDIGYDSGSYTAAPIDKGGTMKESRGEYLVVLRKISGKWLLVQHASTANPQ